jgi:OmpR-family two-component system manganese-sensing response regulator
MSTPRILIVDDDYLLCSVVEKLLAKAGYQVHTATDTGVAMDLISQNHYDLLVLDYMMPGMNGVEIFRQARELQPEVAGVFLTAHTTLDTVFPAIDAGVERVLAKPVDASELLPVVRDLVGQSQAS